MKQRLLSVLGCSREGDEAATPTPPVSPTAPVETNAPNATYRPQVPGAFLTFSLDAAAINR